MKRVCFTQYTILSLIAKVNRQCYLVWQWQLGLHDVSTWIAPGCSDRFWWNWFIRFFVISIFQAFKCVLCTLTNRFWITKQTIFDHKIMAWPLNFSYSLYISWWSRIQLPYLCTMCKYKGYNDKSNNLF